MKRRDFLKSVGLFGLVVSTANWRTLIAGPRHAVGTRYVDKQGRWCQIVVAGQDIEVGRLLRFGPDNVAYYCGNLQLLKGASASSAKAGQPLIVVREGPCSVKVSPRFSERYVSSGAR